MSTNRVTGKAAMGEQSHAGAAFRGVVGHRQYDAIIAELFEMVVRALSREAVLTKVLARLDDADSGRVAFCHFVLESTPARNKETPPSLHVSLHRGLPEAMWANYERDVLPGFANSGVLTDIFTGHDEICLLFSKYIPGYRGVFDIPVRAARGKAIENGYWISAVPLPANRSGRPNRALFGLYPNLGTDLEPRPPAGANQEYRVLQFVQIAYRLLDHQLANIGREILDQRQQLLALIAPGLIHHEVGTLSGSMTTNLAIQRAIVDRLNGGNPRPDDLTRLGKITGTIDQINQRMNLITDAFNNLERRRPQEEVILGRLIEEVAALCQHRVAKVGARIDWRAEELARVRLTTDAALVFHVLLNLITNALNAFSDRAVPRAGRAERQRISLVLVSGGEDGSPVMLDVRNSGPLIPDDLLERIFERGFTTRVDGHGQGLFIARLICQALGGDLAALAPSAQFPDEVCFRITLPQTAPRTADFAAERP